MLVCLATREVGVMANVAEKKKKKAKYAEVEELRPNLTLRPWLPPEGLEFRAPTSPPSDPEDLSDGTKGAT